MKGSRKMQKVKTHNATIPSLSSRRQDGIENVLTDGLVDALGRIVADKQREFETELQKAIEREVRTVTAELRQALAEMRAEAMDRKAVLEGVVEAANLDVARVLENVKDGEPGTKGDKGDPGERGDPGESIVGPKGDKGDQG